MTASEQPNLSPNQPVCAYSSHPNDEDIQDENERSSDYYASSNVLTCREENCAQHLNEKMVLNGKKKHKVGTPAYCETKITLMPAADPFIDDYQSIRSTTSLALRRRSLHRKTLVLSSPGRCRSEEWSPNRDSNSIAGRYIRSIKVTTCVKMALL